MGIIKEAEDVTGGNELAGDAPGDALAEFDAHFRSIPFFLRLYAFHLAGAITACIAASVTRDLRLLIIAAGLCIRPAATWVAFSDAPEPRKAVVAKAAKILRAAFFGYCLYMVVTLGRG
jgi:hypothetical protein